MNNIESLKILNNIRDKFDKVKPPKYRNIDSIQLNKDYELLKSLKPELNKNPSYVKLINAISQTVSRINKTNTLLNITNKQCNLSEKSINKSIKTVVKKHNVNTKFPVEWKDKRGNTCQINNGYWEAKNYMVMDIIGYMFMLKEGGGFLPTKIDPLFNNIEEVKKHENELINSGDKNEKYHIKFKDSDFRKYTPLKLTINKIHELISNTSKTEFKLAFPIRFLEEDNISRETIYKMNNFSQLFEINDIREILRSDGIVKEREYNIFFNTFLGELFVHNLKSLNYDWLRNNFYNLSNSAQIFYRKFISNNNFKYVKINTETIKKQLDFKEKNITYLNENIEKYILDTLEDCNMIVSYIKKRGLRGTKYIIKTSN